MILSIFSILLTFTGIGFVIFIHELGHYLMGRREGMRVETFSIGFGRPLYTWMRGNEKWQIGVIPFGGYVKFAGEGDEDGESAQDIPDGFLAKSPWARIKVAAMGPLVNIVFAFIVFTLLWFSGGREKSYAEVSTIIGWVDEQSDTFQKGLRPGDRIVSYDGYEFTNPKDHLYAAMAGDGDIQVVAKKWEGQGSNYTDLNFSAEPYAHPKALSSDVLTLGVLDPASYLFFQRFPGENDTPLQNQGPAAGSGLAEGDRLVWCDGHVLFSLAQLSSLINDKRVFALIERDGQTLQKRIPTVRLGSLDIYHEVKSEVEDWQYESHIPGHLNDLAYIPYNLNNFCVVESKLDFVDADEEKEHFPSTPFSSLEEGLQAGDKILSINGQTVKRSFELLHAVQKKELLLVVERGSKLQNELPSPTEADFAYTSSLNWTDLNQVIALAGNAKGIQSVGDFHLLKPITPVKRRDLPMSEEHKVRIDEINNQRREQLEAIEDPSQRSAALANFDKSLNQLAIGIVLADQKVLYNPYPHSLFIASYQEIYRTLEALFSGYLSPKWLAGPIGMVQIIHGGWALGIKEGIFWLALISLNLGILNLLPIPVLDGGHICFSILEIVRGKPMKAETMERLIVPFMFLLIGFIIYVTYHDILRVVNALIS